MATFKTFTLLSSTPYSSTAFQSLPEDVGDCNTAAFYLNVTAGTTGTCDVTIQESPDGTLWATATTFSTVSATTASERKTVAQLYGRYVRASVVTTGTNPIYTLSVVGTARS